MYRRFQLYCLLVHPVLPSISVAVSRCHAMKVNFSFLLRDSKIKCTFSRFAMHLPQDQTNSKQALPKIQLNILKIEGFFDCDILQPKRKDGFGLQFTRLLKVLQFRSFLIRI